MKIQSWTWQGKGEPASLVLKETELPDLQEDEILVQNTYIGLNPVDWKLIMNGHPEWKENHVPGVDAAGIIIKAGKNVRHVPLGARVCMHNDLSRNGSFATHTVLKSNAVMHIPANISEAAAAAFPCPGLTAWQALTKVPDVQNKNVLVNGAGGSVGYFITQFLLTRGARVYTIASQKHHAAFYKAGVAGCVDYKNKEFKKELQKQLYGNPLDIVFDTVNGESAAGIMDMIGYYGHVVSVQDRIAASPIPAFTTCVSIHEIALGAFHKYASDSQIAALMADGEKLLKMIGNNELKQRDLFVGDFKDLNVLLQQMKDKNESTKYVLKVNNG